MSDREKLIELLEESNGTCLDVHEEAEDLADHLISNGVTVQKWIPVSESLPTEEAKEFQRRNGEDPTYIVMIDSAEMPTTLFFDSDNSLWYEMRDDGEVVGYKVTHWMPLPEPPKECE